MRRLVLPCFCSCELGGRNEARMCNRMGKAGAVAHRLLNCVMYMVLVLVAFGVLTAGRTEGYFESCSTAANITDVCSAVVIYPSKGEMLSDLANLFNVDLIDLLGANNIDPMTANVGNASFPDNASVRIPLDCGCYNGTLRTNATLYTVQPGDTLSFISDTVFAHLISYQQIAAANGITDPDLIEVDAVFVIPFPCACHQGTYNSTNVVYVTYMVQSGDTLFAIESTFHAPSDSVSVLNNVTAETLINGTVVQVPASACKSGFNKNATDYGLRILQDSYDITAHSCVQCNCYGEELALNCVPSSSALASECSNLACTGGIPIGNFTTVEGDQGCNVTSCSYNGYADSSTVFKRLRSTTESTCPAMTLPTYSAILELPDQSSPSPPPAASMGGEPPASPGGSTGGNIPTAPTPHTGQNGAGVSLLSSLSLYRIFVAILYSFVCIFLLSSFSWF